MRKKGFPVLATIVFLFALFWLLDELSILSVDIPWLPVIIIVIAIGMIFDRFIR